MTTVYNRDGKWFKPKYFQTHLNTSKYSFLGWPITLVFRVAEALQFRALEGIDLGDQLVQQLRAAIIFHLQKHLRNGWDFKPTNRTKKTL